MTLVHRVNTTVADVISNISAARFQNVTAQWGGSSNSTTDPPNWGRIVWEVISVYPDFVGPIAWFILFALPFIMMWITHSDMTPAAIAGLFFGLYIFAYIGSQYSYIGIAFMVLALTAMIWSMWQKRG